MREPKVSTWNRVMWTPVAPFPMLVNAGSNLTVEVQPEFGGAKDGTEQRGEKKYTYQYVPCDLPHAGSVDG